MPGRTVRGLSTTMLGLLLWSGCGDDAAPAADAGPDAGVDAALDSGPPEPVCEPECGAEQACCPDESGAGRCVSYRTDIENCGGCRIDCVALERGTECVNGLCACGSSVLGCPGGTVCCAPRPEGASAYCADFDQDSRDCGGCDIRCDPARADRCDGARCLCGEGSRRQCDGTPADSCCVDSVGRFECVDTTSDRRHCGACEAPCPLGLSCVESTCVEP